MPELPEVATIQSVIEPQIKGLTIQHVTVKRPEVVSYPNADAFCSRLIGQTVSSMMRRGKFLIVSLGGAEGDNLILHLRMTGCLLVVPVESPEEKHTHVILHLSGGTELRFSDPRRFGRFWLLRKEEQDFYSGIGKLGIEPFDPACNAAYLKAHFGKRKRAIKECLMEQKIIAGIGNIYSDEILFQAGICPAAPANCLTQTDWETLAMQIPVCLSYFIEKNKITAKDYLKTKGKEYRNTPFLQVYGHSGAPCSKCGSTLNRIIIGGRSSVYCPVCQKISQENDCLK